VVLWDRIVLRGDNTKLNLKEVKSKYFFFDDGNGLRLVALFIVFHLHTTQFIYTFTHTHTIVIFYFFLDR